MQTATENQTGTPRTAIDDGLGMIARKWPRLYTAIVHHRTTRGEHLTFKDKTWLRAIYKDNSPHIVLMKASQAYISEWAICDLFTLAKKGLRGMYALDSDTRRSAFVADRINKLCDYSPEYRQAIKATKGEADSRVLKTIYGRAMKFIGSRAKGAFYEFTCDAVWIDEYDLHEQDTLIYAQDRIKNSKQKHTRKFGNPTVEGRGIAAEFMLSDQKNWHVECDQCGHEQVLDWERHFVEDIGAGMFGLRDKAWETDSLEEPRPICTECHKPFDRMAKGRWRADNPDSDISGYQISQLFIRTEADDVLQYWKMFKAAHNNPTKLQHFWNNIIGMPYAMTTAKLTDFDLDQCANRGERIVKVRELRSELRMIAGIDQGSDYHVIISEVLDGIPIDRFIGTAYNWTQLVALLDAHNTVCDVIDAQGGGYAETREFVATREGAYMCLYVPKDRIKVPLKVDEETGVIEANRTEWCDIAVGNIKDRNLIVPPDYASIDDGQYKKQMLTPTRVFNPGGRPIWTKGNDHYFHANVYKTIAHEISGMNNSIRQSGSWRV